MKTRLLAGRQVALSVEAGVLRILVLEGRRIQNWLSYPLTEGQLEGDAPSSGTIQSAVEAYRSREGRIRGNVSVCFSSSEALVRTLAIPKLKSRKMVAQAIDWQAEHELFVSKAQVHLFWQPFDAGPDEQNFLLVGLHKDAFAQLYKAVRNAKLRPVLWELKPLALVRAVGRPQVVIANLEVDGTDLIVVSQGVPRLVRSISAQPNSTVDERSRILADEIAQTVQYYTASQPQHAWDSEAPIVLTGGLAGDPDLVQALRAKCAMPVEPFVCPWPCPPDFPAHTYASAIGLMRKREKREKSDRGGAQIDFNVLPGEYTPRAVSPKIVAVTVALLAGVALLYPLVSKQADQGLMLSEQRTALAQSQLKIAASKANLAKNREMDGQIEDVSRLLVTLGEERNTILSLGGEVSSDVSTLLDVAPPSASFVSISVKAEAILVEGEAPNYGTVLEYAADLEQSGKFATVTVVTIGLLEQRDAAPKTTFQLSLERKQPGAS